MAVVRKYTNYTEVVKNHKHLRRECHDIDWSNVVELKTHKAIFYVCDHSDDIVELDYRHSSDTYLIPWVQSECSSCGCKFAQSADNPEIPHTVWLENIQEKER